MLIVRKVYAASVSVAVAQDKLPPAESMIIGFPARGRSRGGLTSLVALDKIE
jgi:hypothetical protein